MKQAGIDTGFRGVVEAALQKEAQTGAPAVAIELPDGTIVTGKTSNLLGASCAALLNAIKVLAGIEDEEKLVAPSAIEPIQCLKTDYLGGKNPRLHTDEILIALSSTAANSPLAKLAMEQLPKLRGCEAHSTVLLSSVDENIFQRLGIMLTSEAKYEQEDRMYHK